MSDRIIKLLGTEIALSSASTLSNAQLVRIFNDTANAVLITVEDTSGITGTVTVKAGEIIFIRKKASETITANYAVKAVSVAFGD